jgi:4-hydroxy-2-oxoheptanedioate aldolase
MEHGSSTTETLSHHVRAALLTGMASIIRVKGVDPQAIGSALDMGSVGVQVPNISTAEEARKAVKAARFYPGGMRGVCRFVRAANYGGSNKEDYFREANKAILILQIEGKEGVENIDEILDVEGYDMLFVGPYDLSQSLGILGQTNSARLIDYIQNLLIKAKEKKILLGTFSDSLENSKDLLDLGFNYISYSVDVSIFRDSVCSLIKEFLREKQ